MTPRQRVHFWAYMLFLLGLVGGFWIGFVVLPSFGVSPP